MKMAKAVGLKVKSAIKAGKIALNHNARPRVFDAKREPANGSPQPCPGLRVKTAIRCGFGVTPHGPGPGGPGG